MIFQFIHQYRSSFSVERMCNVGNVDAVGLKIVDILQYKGLGNEWFQSANSPKIIIENDTIPKGQSKTYYYSIFLTINDPKDKEYRNEAQITITNHSGHIGEPFGPTIHADVLWFNQ
jgi:hypothetical protein